MSLNVNREIEDVYYRYKMPKLMVKVEGKGNGIKTVVSNINDVAKALCRKPTYPIKYFGIELGSQTNMDEKNERFVVNGSHDSIKLQEMLHVFIRKFVLCSKCGNPETMLSVKKKAGNVTSKCKACGHSDILDVKHKLTQYIIKNPPETEIEGAAPTRDDDRADENDDIVAVDVENWIEDIPEKIQSIHIEDVVPSTQGHKEPIIEFFDLVNAKFLDGTLLDDKKDIRKKAKQLRLDEKSVLVLIEIIFKNSRTILTDIVKYKSLFHLFTRVGTSTERYQSYTIAGILKLVEKFNIANKAIYLMQAFYDNDIIEEDTIVDWYDKGPTRKYVSKDLCKEILDSCKPMVEWLKNAAEESAEEDENCAMNDDAMITPKFNPMPQKLITEDDDSDVDIDNI